MNAQDIKTNVTLQAKKRLSVTGVYLASSAVGVWTALVTAWWLYQWSQGQTVRVLIAVAAWPLAWLLSFLVVVQGSFAVAAAFSSVFKLHQRITSRWVTVLILTCFSYVAFHLIRQSDCAANLLGWAWFYGLGLACLARLVRLLGPVRTA